MFFDHYTLAFLQNISRTCAVKVREMNFYKDGDVSPFKQTLTDVTVHRCWSQLLQQSNFEHRRVAVDEFNRYSCFASDVRPIGLQDRIFVLGRNTQSLILAVMLEASDIVVVSGALPHVTMTEHR